MATMSLTQGSGAGQGQITFTWWYTKDYGDPQEIYEGSWSLTDSGEHIDLTMTRSGGKVYEGRGAHHGVGYVPCAGTRGLRCLPGAERDRRRRRLRVPHPADPQRASHV